MCESNIQTITDIFASLTAMLIHALLLPQALAFNIGYSTSLESSSAVLFVQLLLQLCAEVGIDIVSSRIKTNNGVPVERYLYALHSLKQVYAIGMYATSATCLVLYAFVRHPVLAMCSESNPCLCLNKANLYEWYGDACSDIHQTSFFANETVIDDGLFKGIDTANLTVSLATGIGMMAIIALSVLLARNRRKAKVIVWLERKQSIMRKAFDKSFNRS